MKITNLWWITIIKYSLSQFHLIYFIRYFVNNFLSFQNKMPKKMMTKKSNQWYLVLVMSKWNRRVKVIFAWGAFFFVFLFVFFQNEMKSLRKILEDHQAKLYYVQLILNRIGFSGNCVPIAFLLSFTLVTIKSFLKKVSKSHFFSLASCVSLLFHYIKRNLRTHFENLLI